MLHAVVLISFILLNVLSVLVDDTGIVIEPIRSDPVKNIRGKNGIERFYENMETCLIREELVRHFSERVHKRKEMLWI